MAKFNSYVEYFEAKTKRNELMDNDYIRTLTEEEILELGRLIVDIEEFQDIIMNYD